MAKEFPCAPSALATNASGIFAEVKCSGMEDIFPSFPAVSEVIFAASA
jgi:hypothetical protein